MMSRTAHLKIALPLFILLFGISLAWVIMATRPQLIAQKNTVVPPLVTFVTVEPKTIKLNVQSQGLVTPRNEIDLIPEVSGKIMHLHPDFVAGGFFEQGDTLVNIDARDYEAGVALAQSQIAEARRMLVMEEAQVVQAKSEWQALGQGDPSDLVMRVPQLAEARAKLKAAEASLLLAQIKQSRCEIKAPFSGRFKSKNVGLGQFVQPGDKLARLYSTDIAEVRLPLTNTQLGYLNLQLGQIKNTGNVGSKGPKVILSADIAGVTQTWHGSIVRTEGAIDESTGVLYVVAEVIQPYQQKAKQMPLLAHLFVKADIEGKEQSGIFPVPQVAVTSLNTVLVVDNQKQIHSKTIEVIRNEPNQVLVKSGLNAGDKLITSGVDVPLEGMSVRFE